MKTLLIGLLLAIPAFCETFGYVATTGNTAVVASAARATLQQPSSNGVGISFPASPAAGASVYCSVACVASVIIGGTTATATAGTVNPIIINSPPAFVNFFTASDSTGGTTLVSYNVSAGQTFSLDFGALRLGGANSKISIAIASFSGTYNITFFPMEAH